MLKVHISSFVYLLHQFHERIHQRILFNDDIYKSLTDLLERMLEISVRSKMTTKFTLIYIPQTVSKLMYRSQHCSDKDWFKRFQVVCSTRARYLPSFWSEGFNSFLNVSFYIYHWLQHVYFKASFTSTILVQIWCMGTWFIATIIARLRCFT